MVEQTIKASIVIETRMKGVQAVVREGQKIQASLGAATIEKGFKKVEFQLNQVERQLRGLASGLRDFNQSVRGVDRMTQSFMQLGRSAQAAAQSMQSASAAAAMGPGAGGVPPGGPGGPGGPQGGASPRGPRGPRPARRPMLQGFLQGVGGPQFLGRTGALPQFGGFVAGRAVGAAIGVGGGLLQSAITGQAGLERALGAIPGVGGLISGQLRIGMRAAERRIGFEQQLLQSGFLLPRAFGAGTAMGAEILAQPAPERALPVVGPAGNIPLTRTGGVALERGDLPPSALPEQAEVSRVDRERTIQRRLMGEEARRAFEFITAPRERAPMGLRGAAEDVGLALPEALRLATRAADIGGGELGRPGRVVEEGMRATLFAQRAFGIGPETTGQFLFAARRGGLPGFEGQPLAAMEQTIENAMRLGLEGSEIRDFAEQQASLLAEFKRTGIVIDIKSVNQMATTLARVGLGGVQGARVAQGVAAFGRQLAQRGPRTGLDIQFLRYFGGMNLPGGVGPEQLEQGLINVESLRGGGDPDAITGFAREMIRLGGGGASGRLFLGDLLARMGIPLSRGLVQQFGLEVEQGAMSPELKQRVQRELEEGGEAARGFREAGGLPARAMGMAGDALRALAEQSNKELDAGEKLITAYIDLRSVTTNTTSAVGELGPAIQDLTGIIRRASEALFPGYTPGGPQSVADPGGSGSR